MHVTPKAGGVMPPPDDLAGFAQEFLRRNPSYRREYQRLSRDRMMPRFEQQRSHEEMARHWGLCFSV